MPRRWRRDTDLSTLIVRFWAFRKAFPRLRQAAEGNRTGAGGLTCRRVLEGEPEGSEPGF
jgi:hypothetical protein